MLNLKKLPLILLALMLSFSAIITAYATTEVVIEDPTPDTTPPSLDGLSISEVTFGVTYKLTAEISDDLSGVDYVYGYYQSPSGSYSKNLSFGYNSTTKKYEATINFSNYDESGTWKLSSLNLRDQKSNTVSIYDQSSNHSSANSFDFSPFSIEVVGGLEDTIPPEINSIELSPISEVTDGAVINVVADITDEGSGVDYANISIIKPSRATKDLYLSYNQSTGKYEGSFRIDKYDELGIWKLYSISVKDKSRNYKSTYDATLNPSAINTMDLSSYQFEVKETTPDLLSPILDSLSISLVQGSNNSASIKLTANSSDNLSGLSSLDATYTKPSGKSHYVYFSNNYSTGKYEATIPIDKYDELGTWKLTSVSLRDNKGNYLAIMDNLQNYYSKVSMDFSPFYFVVRGIITVPPPTPFSVTSSEKHLSLEGGGSHQLKAFLNMSDGQSNDITMASTGTTYTSSNPAVVTVSKDGLITVNQNAQPDTVYIQIANSGKYAQVKVEVSGGTLKSFLQVDPINLSLSAGQSKQLNVLANLADGTTKDVTAESEIIYSSANNELINVSSSGLLQVSPNAQIGTVKVQVIYNDLVSEVTVNVTGPPVIKGISMTPKVAELSFGETAQLSVRATMSDGTSKVITDGLTGTIYTSSDESKAVVDNNGLIQISENAKSGIVTIKAINSNLITQTTLTINGIPEVTSLEITPSLATLKQGDSQALVVKAMYSNGTEEDVTEKTIFKSANSALAVVDAKGVITIQEDSTGGIVNIVATFEGKTSISEITIPKKPVLESLIFTPNMHTLKQGETKQLEVLAMYSDGSSVDVTSQVFYSSSDDTLATVDNGGLITVKDVDKGGTVYIRGTFNGKGSATTVSIPAYTPPVVTNLEFTADRTEVKPGESTLVKVVATYKDGTTEDVTTKASLNSSYITFASVDANTGLVTISEKATGGIVYIRGSYGGKGGAITLTIPTPPTVSTLTFTPDKHTLKNRESVEIKVMATYTDGTVEDVTSKASLNSSDTTKVTVNSNTGIVTVLEDSTGGTVYIRGSYGGKGGATTITIPAPPYVSSLTFTPSSEVLKPGDKLELMVIANYSDGSQKDVTLSSTLKSTNQNLATVDPLSGFVEVPQQAPNGTVYIQGSYGGTGGSAKLTVSKPYVTGISFTPDKATIKKGDPFSVKVEANYSDGSKEDVTSETTFSSSNPAVAIIDELGNVTVPDTSKGGTVYIRGTYGGKGGASTITVLGPPTVTSLTFTSSSNTLNKGEDVKVSVKALLSDGTSKDVTNEVTYSSSNVNLATVDTTGKVTIADNATSGTVYIRGNYEGKGGAATLVIPLQPSIVSLFFDPPTITLNKGSTLPMKVFANYSNGKTEDVTSKVTFTSSNNIAMVDSTGLVSIPLTSTGGTVYIRATYGGKGAASTVRVQ